MSTPQSASTILTPINGNYTSIDFTQTNAASVTNNPNLVTVQGTNVAFGSASADGNPVGLWVINNQQATAHDLVMGKLYQGWLSGNSNIQTQLSALNIGVTFANASSSFSASLKKDIATMGQSDTRSYTSLVGLVTNDPNINLGALGMSAQQFINTVLPNETASASYTQSSYTQLASTVDQYTTSKTTNNSVLQLKLNDSQANLNTLVTAMAGLITANMNLNNSILKDII